MSASRLLTAVLVAGLLGASAVSCAEETTPSSPRTVRDGGGSGTDAGEEPEYVFDDGKGTGTTWKDLYADLFGPSSKGGCAGEGNACHGSNGAAGTQRTLFVCADEAGCRESILGESKLVEESEFAKPENAFLVAVLRKKRADGEIGGTQPKDPLFVFHASSIDRIKTWISNGAPAE